MAAVDIKTEDQRIVIRLAGACTLYGPGADQILGALTAVAERMHQPSPPDSGVLVLQDAPYYDIDDQALRVQMETSYLDEFARAFDDLRWLLFLVRHSPVPWTYAAADDCLGSAFELALSCHKRLWFSPQARLGFPAIVAGFFPPGGVIEALNKRAGRSRDSWQAKPLMTAQEARADGMIDFCSRAVDWQKAAMEWFNLLHRERERGDRRAPQRAARIDFATPRDAQARQSAFESLEFLTKTAKADPAHAKSAWEVCWELVKERAKLKDPRDLGRLIAYVAARHALSAEFIAWMAQQRAHRCARPQAFLNAAPIARVVIDLDYLAPPTDVLCRLLKQGIHICFIGTEADSLGVALNLIFNRLERALGAEQANRTWAQLVSWCDTFAATTMVRWLGDDRMVIVVNDMDVSLIRLAGNASAAAAGYLEWWGGSFDAKISEQALTIMRLVSDGVITTPNQAIPRSVHLRSLFLEELLRATRFIDGDLSALVAALAARGWGFAGNEDAWDRFLSARHEVYRFDPAASGFTTTQLDRSLWDLNSFKAARASAKKLSASSNSESPDSRWNPTALSQHMAIFLGTTLQIFAGTRVVDGVMDSFCSLALGFPAVFGSPMTFLARYGRRRFEKYAALHWPNLPQNLGKQTAIDI